MKKAIVIALFCGEMFGQAPGGITTGLTGWYDASYGLTLVSTSVSAWDDKSVNNRDGSQGTVSKRPLPNANGFNYNQTLQFNGQTNYISIPTQMVSGNTALTAFAVARQTASNRDAYGVVLLGQAAAAISGQGYGLTATGAANTSFGFFVNSFGNNITSSVTTLSVPSLMSGNWNGTSAGNLQYYQGGTLAGTDAYASTVGNGGGSFIGAGETGGDFCFYGDIAEVAIYSVGISTANMPRIESYFALKYGITKTGSYQNSSGTVIFNNAAPYNTNIIGLGQDNNSTLLQKQSRTYDDSVRIFISTIAATNTLNTGTFASNNQFLVIGANTGRFYGQATEMPGTVSSRINREWQVTNTGFSGTFSFGMKLNAKGNPTTVNPAHLRLLVDTDGDFSNATVYNLTITYSNPEITVSGITTAMIPTGSTRFITIASTNNNTPLPVELLSFDAYPCNNDVCVKWQTATEKDNEDFEIERSADGTSWQIISSVKGAGTSSQIQNYEIFDREPLTGLSYYRLKQNDFNKESFYSNIISVNNGLPIELQLYSNPADGEIMLTGAGLREIQVSDAFGRIMNNMLEFSYRQDGALLINTSKLRNGIYFIMSPAISQQRRQGLKFLVSH